MDMDMDLRAVGARERRARRSRCLLCLSLLRRLLRMEGGAVGTAAHTHWLEAQLTRQSSPRQFSPGATFVSTSQPQTSLPSPPRRRRDDTAVGTPAHSDWLNRYIPSNLSANARRYGSTTAHTPPIPRASPPRQPDIALPAGVNAMIRGQDLSAKTHAEWLDRQFSRGGGATPGGGGSAGAGRNARSQHEQWLAWQLRGLPSPSASTRSFDGMDVDCALGSGRHSAWLERQLGSR